MELQFQETAFRCLRSSAADTRSAEQTLEVRLPGAGGLGSAPDPG